MRSYDGSLRMVEADQIKFCNNPEEFSNVTDMIDAQLFGLFNQK